MSFRASGSFSTKGSGSFSAKKQEKIKRKQSQLGIREVRRSLPNVATRPSLFRLGSVAKELKGANAEEHHRGIFCCPCLGKAVTSAEPSALSIDVVGSVMTMVTSKGKERLKFFWVDPATNSICWCIIVGLHIRRVQSLYFSFVVEIRPGQRTLTFEKVRDAASEHLCFSIIYFHQNELKTMDLVCKTAAQVEMWVNGLRKLVSKHNSEIHSGDPTRDYAMYQWKRIGAKDFVLRKDLRRHFRSMNLRVGRKFVMSQFAIFDVDRNGVLNFGELCNFLESLRVRPELIDLWTALNKDPDGPASPSDKTDLRKVDTSESRMTAETFLSFLTGTQGESMSLAEARELLARYEGMATARLSSTTNIEELVSDRSVKGGEGELTLSYQGFLRYIRATSNGLVKPEEATMNQVMTHPLNDYFIHSSHNTYLTGDQLRSASSVDMYIRCFRSGVRSVELDLWDGPEGPVITHGKSVTSAILAEDVVRVVSEYAFPGPQDANVFQGSACPFQMPVILSLENHLSIDQQKTMASIFKEVLGDRLALTSADGKLQSPADLKGRVLLKGKRIRHHSSVVSLNGTPGHRTQSLFEDPDMEAIVQSTEGEKNIPSFRQPIEDKVKLAATIAQELSDIIYLDSVKIKSWEDSWEKALGTSMSSFGDHKLSLFNADAGSMCRYNSKQLSRIYPSPSKDSLLKSANYDPMAFWCKGCQMVSLNVQTMDKPMRVANALFAHTNGKCGYILKPEFMRVPCPKTGKYFAGDPAFRESFGSSVGAWKLTIEIISAQQLPKPRHDEVIDPFVKLEVMGIECDHKVYRTSTVRSNGFSPSWQEVFEFDIACPEMAQLYLEIIDEDITTQSVPVAYYAIPLMSMRQGYREVPLLDMAGSVLNFSSMFVRVKIDKINS